MKLIQSFAETYQMLSPPARGRGLKHTAPATNANCVSRPPRGGVD